MSWTLVVEGKFDKEFMKWLLRRSEIVDVEVKEIGSGFGKLKKIQPVIKMCHDGGLKIAILLDADKDMQGRRNRLDEPINELELPVERIFATQRRR